MHPQLGQVLILCKLEPKCSVQLITGALLTVQQADEIAYKMGKKLQHKQTLSGMSWKIWAVSKQIKVNEKPNASEGKKAFSFPLEDIQIIGE